MTTMTTPRLGCIADDFTGATDLANNLARGGMRTVVTVGVPEDRDTLEADAVVIALKTRTTPAAEAVSTSLHACRRLKAYGVGQIYFKICSTFDSTARGNIGPVLEALMDELGCSFSIVAPAFPDNGRTVCHGYLFVHGILLSESSMRHHPLTPMTDSNLLRLLAPQLSPRWQDSVGLLPQRIVGDGNEDLRRAMDDLQSHGVRIAVADSITRDDMARLAAALHDAPLVTASSGLAVSLPGQLGFAPSEAAAQLPIARGRCAILAGSCSEATNRQVQHFLANGGKGWQLDALELAGDAGAAIERVLRWTEAQWRMDSNQPLLVYSTVNNQGLTGIRERTGWDEIGCRVEQAMGRLAVGLTGQGAGRLVVAGGETSGACVQALQISQLRIGPQIDPGVPWCYAGHALGASGGLHLALKSGNFGSDDFFTKAFALLPGEYDDEAAL